MNINGLPCEHRVEIFRQFTMKKFIKKIGVDLAYGYHSLLIASFFSYK